MSSIKQPSSLPQAQYMYKLEEEVFAKYAQRLESFSTADTKYNLKPTEMAKAGLFYTQKLDRVRCFKCHVEIGKWSIRDSSLGTHNVASPLCKFVKSNDQQRSMNIPLLQSKLTGQRKWLCPLTCFQANTRLQNYFVSPELKINDETLDFKSSTYWDQATAHEVKNNVQTERKKAFKLPITREEINEISQPQYITAQQWYIMVIYQAKSYQQQAFDAKNPSLDWPWSMLTIKQKSKYRILERMDKKCKTAQVIENIFRIHNLHIGICYDQNHNRTVLILDDANKVSLVSESVRNKINKQFDILVSDMTIGFRYDNITFDDIKFE